MAKKREISNAIDNLYKIGRIFRDAEKKPRCYGTDELLYPNEAYTLKAVVENEGINQKDLSDIMFRTKGATSIAVQKLTQRGLVVSRNDRPDQRMGSLYPTEAGMAVYKAHREYDARYIEELCRRIDLSTEDIATANYLLEQIIDASSRKRKVTGASAKTGKKSAE